MDIFNEMKINTPSLRTATLALCLLTAAAPAAFAQAKRAPSTSSKQPAPPPKGLEVPAAVPEKEEDYYKLTTLPIPENVVLEVGGLAALPDGRLAVSTRRGEVWVISNPYMANNARPHFTRFAQGLHEPLGLAYKNGALYLSQRSELTRLQDTNGDGKADLFESVYAWPLSGNYHEYAYGPVIQPDGSMLVTLNLGWVGRGNSPVPWRGWLLSITPEGEMTPVASGLRSPAGFARLSSGDIFYSENQGDWVGSGRMTHLRPGDFAGNPAGLAWTSLPGSPLQLKPTDIPDTGEPMYEVAKKVPGLKPPAIWFPHGILGISTAAILEDTTGGAFGPFAGQLFVADQGHSKIMRVALEQVDGEYQGATFPFREGFSSGLLRLVWGQDGSMFGGMTSRGWGSTGKDPYGLQRLEWTGKVPFEIMTMRAQPDGFELEFTQPVDPAAAADPGLYQMTGFNYKYHHNYGSPVINKEPCPVRKVVVSADGRKVRLVVGNLRKGYIHELKVEGLRSAENKLLLHDVAYYTLNNIPAGESLPVEQQAVASAAHQHASAMTPAAGTRAGSRSSRATAPAKAPAATAATAATAAPAATAKHVTTMPASWKAPDQTITIGTRPNLKFSQELVEVKAGSKIKLTFTNDDDMLHNFVLVLPGTAVEVGTLALKMGLDGQAQNYVPPTDKVLYHTLLLQPETAETIYFTAPTTPGEYTYVCTVPGHFYVMQGKLKVVK
jgi:azurin/glucose/arabinose dehydrogenase